MAEKKRRSERVEREMIAKRIAQMTGGSWQSYARMKRGDMDRIYEVLEDREGSVEVNFDEGSFGITKGTTLLSSIETIGGDGSLAYKYMVDSARTFESAVEGGRVLVPNEKIDKVWGGLPLYRPLDQQKGIHKSRARIILVIGGNRAGKSECILADLAFQLQMKGRLGFLPLRAWIFRPKFADLEEEDPVYEKLWFGKHDISGFKPPLIAPAMQKRLMKRNRVMMLQNGSTISTWSYNQRTEAIAGQEPNIIIADEEPPERLFREINARLVSGRGTYFMVGATRTNDYPYIDELEKKAANGDPDVAVFRLLSHENTYLDSEQLAFAERMMPEHERSLRLLGGTRRDGARIYRPSPKTYQSRENLPEHGTDYVYMDPGIGAYTAVLWVRAVHNKRYWPDGKPMCDIWCHQEYYKRGMFNLTLLCNEIMEMNGDLSPVEWVMDPFHGIKRLNTTGPNPESVTYMEQFNEEADRFGVRVRLGSRTREMLRGIRAMETRKWMDHNDITRPNIYIIDDMTHLRSEINRYVIKNLVNPRDDISHARQEQFGGPDHLIYDLEAAVTEKVTYLAANDASHNTLTYEQRLANEMWNALGGSVNDYDSPGWMDLSG